MLQRQSLAALMTVLLGCSSSPGPSPSAPDAAASAVLVTVEGALSTSVVPNAKAMHDAAARRARMSTGALVHHAALLDAATLAAPDGGAPLALGFLSID